MAETETLREELSQWRWLLVVAAAQETGMIAALASGTLALDDLVERLGLDRRAAYVIAEALVAGGFAEAKDGGYRLAPAARRLLVDESDEAYLAPSVLHSRDLIARWLQLPGVLKGVRPEPRPGMRRSPATFIGTMAVGARASAAAVVERCLARFPAAKSVLDVGGGPGVHAGALLARGLAVTILDLPDVIDLVRTRWAGTDGVTLVPGDFTVGLPPGPFDLVLLGNVCHIYGPAENQRLFARVAGVLRPGGGVAILDFVRGRSVTAALFGVNMLAGSGGTWTEAEYRDWLAAAGFTAITVEDLNGPERQLILGQKA